MTATEQPRTGQGAVALDIGDDVGALVVYTPPTLAGAELEICPAGRREDPPDDGTGWWVGQWRTIHRHLDQPTPAQQGPARPAWPHVSVLARHTPVGTIHAAVFPALREGSYHIWRRPDGPTHLEADIHGATVTHATWP